ncbi:PilZ domain-containing protein [Devosia rhodophyticola]|uniref:PilZ domain-containing protein n=1 Tax=Devosia rhodophyticola TaxID=3026423 RepID=A0ABY7YTI4_9HYPH|nr:PilZ domain-containing protein [Devosia rhodophyticola]WDR04517.1 PilZ domain-containing protein [Devosia rhodophyticola]
MSTENLAIDTETLRRRLQQDEQKNAHKRRFERHSTFIVARMVMQNTSQQIDGVVNEMSLGGMRFRPASKYLQKRDGDTVSLIIEDTSFTGRIRASRPDGYGIELLDMMSEGMMAEFLMQQ